MYVIPICMYYLLIPWNAIDKQNTVHLQIKFSATKLPTIHTVQNTIIVYIKSIQINNR